VTRSTSRGTRKRKRWDNDCNRVSGRRNISEKKLRV
jgi:hypothetical protein